MKSGKKLQKTTDYLCEKCNRKFETASGLWKHNKKCKKTMLTDSNDDIINDKKLILLLINQNKELIEMVKNGKYNENSSI
jgi:ribosomal protein L37AE/L43A